MKILYIAPLPPPVSGQSLAAKVLHDALANEHKVEVVDIKKESLEDGIITSDRLFQMVRVFKEILRKKRKADVLYLTISETLAGNIRDVLIYLFCLRSLPKMVIHLHGGSIGKLLFEKHRLLYKINQFFIRRMGGVIVLGKSHVTIFSKFVPAEKIHIVPNFAEDNIFLDRASIRQKFENQTPLRFLFLSNLIAQKGYNDLLDAFLAIDEKLKKTARLDFAGQFANAEQKKQFVEKIKAHPEIQYHGVVHREEKERLLAGAHVFCLPTSLLEGQPISILEAYASGCVVVTTTRGGIGDIFKKAVNGFEVQQQNVRSIQSVIEYILQEPELLLSLALKNREEAETKFKTSIYNTSVLKVFTVIAQNGNGAGH